MSEYQEFTGKTVEDAIRQAREAFGVSGLADLDFEILTPGSRGVLGMGAEQARIIAAPKTALGGTAPRREAAAAAPLPAPSQDRGDRPSGDRDRGPRREGDRDRSREGDRDRGRTPREHTAPPRQTPITDERASSAPAGWGEVRGQDAAPTPAPEGPTPTAAQPAARISANVSEPVAPRGRGPRRDDRDRREPRREPRSEDRRPPALTQRDQDALATARSSLSAEREEMQAAEASPEALAAGKEILERLLDLMGYHATVTITAGDTSKLDVAGDESEKEALGALIGRKGERLSALQHLVNLMLSRRMGSWTRVLVDVEDYRGRRERQLVEIAQRAADRVVESGAMLQLEPMPALERRWIHLALRGHARVTTQSIGEEPQRRVVILRRD